MPGYFIRLNNILSRYSTLQDTAYVGFAADGRFIHSQLSTLNFPLIT